MGATSLNEATPNVAKYALIEKIGEGHLGPAYRGFDQELGNPVVVRILCEGIRWDPKLEARFESEMKRITSLQHVNIARVLDFGKEGQTRYIVTESLGNGTLESLIAQNSSVPVEKKLSIMIQISEGLSHAHKNGVLHHDLVPGKIHLTPDGNAKIRDFAATHILLKSLPHPVVRWGAPIYLCPEQIQRKECDARSDIFSIGTIFYELITHCHPFHDRDSNRALDNIVSDMPIATFEKFPDAPPGIWNILRTCLAKNPDERYAGADELAKACRELLVSLAEDKQLVLSELYAALAPLRKAAAQPNTSPGTRSLMNEIQSLVRGEKEADYACLDRLMTTLMEQYPAIQAAANAPPAIDSICPQLPPEEPEAAKAPEAEPARPLPVPAAESSVIEAMIPEEQKAPVPAAAESAASLLGTELIEDPVPQQAPETKAEVSDIPLADAEDGAVDGTRSTSPDEMLPQIPAELVPTTFSESTVPEEALCQQSSPRYRRIPMPSYRTTVVLLSLLVIAAASYIVWGTKAAESIRNAWDAWQPSSNSLLQRFDPRRWGPSKTSASEGERAQSRTDRDGQNPSDILMDQAHALAAENRIEESRRLLRRILETNPSYTPALEALKTLESSTGGFPGTPPEESLARITLLLNSGKLQSAKSEIDRLQQLYPNAPEVPALHRKWQALGSKQVQEQIRKEEEQQRTLLKQKEDEWGRQVAEFFARGKYTEAAGALSLWLAENPGSSRAQELNARAQEIQRQLKIYSSAMSESRYSDALGALSSAEKLNPNDSNLGDLRHQAEDRKAAARATLTVHRLGAKANLLLDGRAVGKDGELDNEALAIGSHTLAIENGGSVIASRVQEYTEGQRVVLVYDLLKQNLRAMADPDRDALAQRKAMEDVQRFSLVHDHGVFRGSCRGTLSLNYLDVAYTPSTGSHGFRIPFKLLKLKTQGTAASLYYIADNSRFQTFQFQDIPTADKFRQKWDELKALLRQRSENTATN